MTQSSPYDDYPFQGMEAAGLILTGSLPMADARLLTDGRFEPQPLAAEPERAEAHIHTLLMRDLKIRGLPLVRFNYPETVWNLRVVIDGETADLSVQAHTNLMMRVPLALFDKYNTVLGRIRLEKEDGGGKLRIERAGKALSLTFTTGAEASDGVPMIRRLFTRSKPGQFYVIPWGDTVPERLVTVECQLEERSLADHVFGPQWRLEGAFFFANRRHFCAPSVPVPATRVGSAES